MDAARDRVTCSVSLPYTWGAPRIRNELAKIGINVSRSTVAKYMVRHRKPPLTAARSPWQNPYVERLTATPPNRGPCKDLRWAALLSCPRWAGFTIAT